ncbi:MAG: hypothetical protein ACRC7H_00950, partial [Plesiomonas shigelloides]
MSNEQPEPLLELPANVLNNHQVGSGLDDQTCVTPEPLVSLRPNDEETSALDEQTNQTNETMTDTSLDETQRLVRDGGRVGEYTVVPRRKFNSLEVHRILNLRSITTTDMADYVTFLHESLSEIVSFSRQLAGDGRLINITLRGPSLTSDVNSILSSANNYSVTILEDQIEKIMQSNSN